MLSKQEIQFWIPILVTVVSMALGWGTLRSDIRSLAEAIDNHDKNVQAYQKRTENLVTAINEFSRRLTILETQFKQ